MLLSTGGAIGTCASKSLNPMRTALASKRLLSTTQRARSAIGGKHSRKNLQLRLPLESLSNTWKAWRQWSGETRNAEKRLGTRFGGNGGQEKAAPDTNGEETTKEENYVPYFN